MNVSHDQRRGAVRVAQAIGMPALMGLSCIAATLIITSTQPSDAAASPVSSSIEKRVQDLEDRMNDVEGRVSVLETITVHQQAALGGLSDEITELEHGGDACCSTAWGDGGD